VHFRLLIGMKFFFYSFVIVFLTSLKFIKIVPTFVFAIECSQTFSGWKTICSRL